MTPLSGHSAQQESLPRGDMVRMITPRKRAKVRKPRSNYMDYRLPCRFATGRASSILSQLARERTPRLCPTCSAMFRKIRRTARRRNDTCRIVGSRGLGRRCETRRRKARSDPPTRHPLGLEAHGDHEAAPCELFAEEFRRSPMHKRNPI